MTAAQIAEDRMRLAFVIAGAVTLLASCGPEDFG